MALSAPKRALNTTACVGLDGLVTTVNWMLMNAVEASIPRFSKIHFRELQKSSRYTSLVKAFYTRTLRLRLINRNFKSTLRIHLRLRVTRESLF